LFLTDDDGDISDANTVSLRPDTNRKIGQGKTDLYEKLYGRITGQLFHSTQTTFAEETLKLANIVASPNATTVADITVIPFEYSKLSQAEMMHNIKLARAIPIYNLCVTTFKTHALQNHSDMTVKECLEKVKIASEALGFKPSYLSKEAEVVMAAYACTQAVIEACFGDPYALDTKYGSDLSTQATVSLCCAVGIVDDMQFFDFLRAIQFYDDAAHLLEGQDDDKMPSP
jgi:hypothetical protein